MTDDLFISTPGGPDAARDRLYGLPVRIVELNGDTYVLNEMEINKALARPVVVAFDLADSDDRTLRYKIRAVYDPTPALRSLSAVSLVLAGLGETMRRTGETMTGFVLRALEHRQKPHQPRSRGPHRRKHPVIRRHRP